MHASALHTNCKAYFFMIIIYMEQWIWCVYTHISWIFMNIITLDLNSLFDNIFNVLTELSFAPFVIMIIKIMLIFIKMMSRSIRTQVNTNPCRYIIICPESLTILLSLLSFPIALSPLVPTQRLIRKESFPTLWDCEEWQYITGAGQLLVRLLGGISLLLVSHIQASNLRFVYVW